MRIQSIVIGMLFILVLTSCSSKVILIPINLQPYFHSNEKVIILEKLANVPNESIRVAALIFQNSGLTTDCGLNSLLYKSKKIAREKGANIVKIMMITESNLWPLCYSLQLELYRYNGDLSNLSQYELKRTKD